MTARKHRRHRHRHRHHHHHDHHLHHHHRHQQEHRHRHRRQRLAALAAVVLAGCSTASDAGEGATDGTVAPAPTVAPVREDGDVRRFVETYEDAALSLRSVIFIDVDPWRDLRNAVDQLRATDPQLAELEAAVPGEMPTELRDEYDAVLDAIGAWRTEARAAADELERRLDELQPLATAWADRIDEGADEPPPAEIRGLVDAGRDAADRLAQECTEFANAADVVIDCFSLFGEPGAPDAADGPAEFSESGTLAIVIDDVELLVDVGDASGGTSFGDRAAFELGPMTRLWVLPGVDVRDPTGPPGGALTDTIPWPATADEIDDWIAGLGRDSRTEESIRLGGRTWRRITILPDGTATPLLVNPRSDTGSIDIPGDAPLHLWIADLDGVPAIATLAVGVAEDDELFVEVARTVLATLRSA